MKGKKIVGLIMIIALLLVGTGLLVVGLANGGLQISLASGEEETNLPSTEKTSTYRSATADGEQDLTLEEMLTYAMEDEYRARAEYALIMETYGEQNPFMNIMKAEETHIAALTPLFEKYGAPLPEDQGKDHAILPNTLQTAYETGVQAEIDNIGMYEKFLQSKDLPEDVKGIFTALMKASQNHLQAFQKAADGTYGNANGMNRNGHQGGYGQRMIPAR